MVTSPMTSRNPMTS